VWALCQEWGKRLRLLPSEPHPARVLWAIFRNEQYNEANPEPRLEKSYCPNGTWFNKVLWDRYGHACAKSYSNFQIMFATAWEHGYHGRPQDLDDDKVAIRYVVDLINWRIIRLAQRDDYTVTLGEILDGYNTGNPRDNIVNEAYVKRGTGYYQESEKRWSVVA